MARRRIITVGDVVRYKPTGHVDTVKAIYAGSMTGTFKCAGGTFRQARAILVLERDSGHYPVGDDIELLLPEDIDEEARYPVGGGGRPTEYACGKCKPSRFPDKTKEIRWLCGRCYYVRFLDKQRAKLIRCSEHGLVWHYSEKRPPEGMEYVCKLCNPSVGPGEPTVPWQCSWGGGATPHVLVPKE